MRDLWERLRQGVSSSSELQDPAYSFNRSTKMQDDAKTYTSPQLLSPDNHSLILVDQQYLVLITMRSHEVTQVVEAMTLLAKGAKLFGVRTLLTTAHSETQKLVQQVQDVFADHVPIERTGLNAFEDERSRSTRIASRFPSPKEL